MRYELPGEWGRLLGLDRSCAPDTLRRKLGELAGGEDAVQAWREQLARQWVSAAADDVATLFVDGHVQVYHGQANLPKHFVSRDRLKLPAAAGYWVHAPGGAPLLCLHKQVDPGMVAELRSAIVPQLEALGLLEPWLGAGQQEPRLTLAFDREGSVPIRTSSERAPIDFPLRITTPMPAERAPERPVPQRGPGPIYRSHCGAGNGSEQPSIQLCLRLGRCRSGRLARPLCRERLRAQQPIPQSRPDGLQHAFPG